MRSEPAGGWPHSHRPAEARDPQARERAASGVQAPAQRSSILGLRVRGRDRVVLLESYEQGWQRRAVIVTLLHEIAGLSQRKTGKLLDLSQPLDPRTVSPMPIGPEKAAGSKNPLLVVVRQRLSDALGQGLLDFWKLILVLVAFLFFLGILLHSFRILQRVVVVVEPHDAIERMGQDPVKRRSQSLRFLLQRIDRRSDLEIAGAAALDRHGQLPILKSRIEALPLGDITHLQVILDVALKQDPPPLA